MRKQDHIISLISSLTPAEKKYFIQSARANGKEPDYLRLYEELLTSTQYDADVLSQKLGKKKTDLANEKKYLEKVLMKSLRDMNAERPHIQPMNSLADAVLLIDRGLYNQASVSLKRTIEQSKKMSLPHLEWFAHGLMLTICSEPNISTNQTQSISAHHLAALNNCAKHISTTSAMEQLSFQVFDAYDTRHYDNSEEERQETRALIAHPLLTIDHEDEEIQFQKFNLLTLLYSRLRDEEATVDVTTRWVNMVETRSYIEPNEYVTALSCHAQALIATRNAEKISAWIDRLQSRHYLQLPVNADRMDALLTRYLYWHVSGAHYALLITGKTLKDKNLRFIDQFLAEWQTVKASLTANHLITATCQTASCALVLGRAEDCERLLNLLFNEIGMEVHPYRWGQARILLAMTLFSEGHFKLFPSAVKNAVYYLKKRKLYGRVERVVLSHFDRLPNEPTQEELVSWLKHFRAEMETLAQEIPALSTVEHLPYRPWAEDCMRMLE